MIKILCFEDVCPIPLMKLKDALIQSLEKEIVLVVDRHCVVENIELFCKEEGHDFKVLQALEGVWELTVIRH